MKIIYYSMLFAIFSLFYVTYSYADAFYAEKEHPESQENAIQAVKNTQKDAKNQVLLPACLPKDLNSLSITTEFLQLKLVGIVKFNEQFSALFLDEQQRIIDLKTNDFIENSGVQINEISLKEVRYIDWYQNTTCNNPKIITLKL